VGAEEGRLRENQRFRLRFFFGTLGFRDVAGIVLFDVVLKSKSRGRGFGANGLSLVSGISSRQGRQKQMHIDTTLVLVCWMFEQYFIIRNDAILMLCSFPFP